MKGNSKTLADVAKLAGVSPSTVSRVIADNPKISEKTKKRVVKCMEEIGYYPNAIAQSLANKRTGNIGIIMPHTEDEIFLNPFFPEALRGIVKETSNTDYDLLLSTNAKTGEELAIVKKLIRGSKVDGIILMSSKQDDECINYLKDIEFPFVLIGSPYEMEGEINHVDNDNENAAYELTKYLIEIGSEKIAFIGGDEKLVVTKKRIEGYKRALKDMDKEFKDDLLLLGSFNEKTGFKYGDKIANMSDMPDGLIVTDDLVAFGVLKVFEGLGIKVPEDIALGSFNNSILSQHSPIPFTSVEINAFELGKKSINLLTKVIEKDIHGQLITVPYKIMKRDSTDRR
nr:LacI family DNA-binding transcriptional regulator [Tissierella sp.]